MLQLAAALEWLGRYGTLILALGVFLGLGLPDLAAALRPALGPIVFVNLALALARLDWAPLAAQARAPGRATLLVVWLLLICPVLAWAGCRAAGLPEGLTIAVVLMAATVPIASAPAFALLLGLDAPLAVTAVVAPSVLVPLTLPPVALHLLGLTLELPLVELAGRLGLMLVGAIVTAVLARRLVSRGWLDRRREHLDGVTVLVLLVFAIAVMDGVGAVVRETPQVAVLYLAVGFIANAALQFAGALAFWPLDRRSALTVGFVSGNRNMGLMLAVLGDGASAAVTLYFAIAQFPMYILPALLKPLYRRLAPACHPRRPD